jgi:hypothetical protein
MGGFLILNATRRKVFLLRIFFGVEAFDRGYGLTGGWVRSGPEKGAGVGMGVMHPVFVIIM